MNKIEKLVPGGQGIATLEDGKKAFFWNVLPGEEVLDYEITKKKSKYIEAIATKIQNESPHRIAPRDNIYISTSPWQIMDYDFELSAKLDLLKESFRQEGLVDYEFSPVQTDGREFFYRNKMEYSLYWDIAEAKIKLAVRLRGTHRKVIIENSSLEMPEIYQKALEIINDLNARHEEARKYQSLLLRANQQGEISGGLFENGKPHPIFNNLTDTLLGHEYSYSPNGFFQINLPVYEMALKEIATHIHTDEVLDLYAGVGTIGLSTAKDKDLTLVECNKDAFGELHANVLRTSANSIEAICANSEDALDYISPNASVILDPPRAGCDMKLINKLLEVKPPKIIYLSCNPATQARDLKMLTTKYRIDKIQPYNFFPRTPHLENLVVLSVL